MVGSDDYRARTWNVTQTLHLWAKEDHQKWRKESAQDAVRQVVHEANLAPKGWNVRI